MPPDINPSANGVRPYPSLGCNLKCFKYTNLVTPTLGYGLTPYPSRTEIRLNDTVLVQAACGYGLTRWATNQQERRKFIYLFINELQKSTR